LAGLRRSGAKLHSYAQPRQRKAPLLGSASSRPRRSGAIINTKQFETLVGVQPVRLHSSARVSDIMRGSGSALAPLGLRPRPAKNPIGFVILNLWYNDYALWREADGGRPIWISGLRITDYGLLDYGLWVCGFGLAPRFARGSPVLSPSLPCPHLKWASLPRAHEIIIWKKEGVNSAKQRWFLATPDIFPSIPLICLFYILWRRNLIFF